VLHSGCQFTPTTRLTFGRVKKVACAGGRVGREREGSAETRLTPFQL
jgi:hypothetical protein